MLPVSRSRGRAALLTLAFVLFGIGTLSSHAAEPKKDPVGALVRARYGAFRCLCLLVSNGDATRVAAEGGIL
jgi:hypothetical protein